MTTTREAVYVEPGQVEWREAPAPSLSGDGQAIVAPLAVASCDLDRAIIDGRAPFPGPFALGHEMIAEVVEIGDGVAAARPGDRVAVTFQVACGECDRCARGLEPSCRHGGMYGIGAAGGDFGGALRDTVLVPFADAMFVPLPDGVDPVIAASAPDNIADAWRAIVPPLRDRPGGRVLIVAGRGANSISLYAVQIARVSGAETVEVLTPDERLAAKADALGAEVALVKDWPESHGRFDVALEYSNEPPGVGCALRSLRSGGYCTMASMHFGGEASVPALEMYLKGLTLTSGRVNSRRVLPQVLELIVSGAIDPGAVTSEVASWDDAPEALMGYTTKLVVTRA